MKPEAYRRHQRRNAKDATDRRNSRLMVVEAYEKLYGRTAPAEQPHVPVKADDVAAVREPASAGLARRLNPPSTAPLAAPQRRRRR